MDNPSAKLKVAVFDRTVCVQVSGRADFTCTVDLKKLIAELWDRGYSHFIFDLCDCRMMDSTFMGVLAEISLQLSNGSGQSHPLELLNANPRICETLENLGVAGLFQISSSAGPITDKFEPLSQADPASPVEMARTCLKAHQTLIAVHPENAQTLQKRRPIPRRRPPPPRNRPEPVTWFLQPCARRNPLHVRLRMVTMSCARLAFILTAVWQVVHYHSIPAKVLYFTVDTPPPHLGNGRNGVGNVAGVCIACVLRWTAFVQPVVVHLGQIELEL